MLKDMVAMVMLSGARRRHCNMTVRPVQEINSATLHTIHFLNPEAH